MNSQKKKYPMSVIFMWAMFYGGMALIIFEAFKSGGWVPLMLILIAMMIMIDWTIKTEWNPIHSNPNFFSMDGCIGVIENNITPMHGGRARCTVTVKKSYVPKEKWYRSGNVNGFLSSLTGKVQIDIEDLEINFFPIHEPNLGAKEGAILYLGSISGKPVKSVDYRLQKKLDFAMSIISKIETQYEKAKAISNVESQQGSKNVLDAVSKVGAAIKEFKSNQENPQQMNPYFMQPPMR